MTAINTSKSLEPNNPANASPEAKGARRARIPMSVPMLKLEVPEIPGYHSHWIRGDNIQRALAAWYEFVGYDEIPVNQLNPATDAEVSGNTDLGSQVSIAAGVDKNGHPQRLTLMKLKEEHWLADRKKIDERNASVMEAIFRGEKIIDEGADATNPGDTSHRYVDPERTRALFNRRRAKR
jgi:hypothetical protein